MQIERTARVACLGVGAVITAQLGCSADASAPPSSASPKGESLLASYDATHETTAESGIVKWEVLAGGDYVRLAGFDANGVEIDGMLIGRPGFQRPEGVFDEVRMKTGGRILYPRNGGAEAIVEGNLDVSRVQRDAEAATHTSNLVQYGCDTSGFFKCTASAYGAYNQCAAKNIVGCGVTLGNALSQCNDYVSSCVSDATSEFARGVTCVAYGACSAGGGCDGAWFCP